MNNQNVKKKLDRLMRPLKKTGRPPHLQKNCGL